MPLGLKERGAHHCQGTPMLCCKGHEKWTGGWRRICCREDFHFKVGDVAASVVEWSGSKGNDDRPRAGDLLARPVPVRGEGPAHTLGADAGSGQLRALRKASDESGRGARRCEEDRQGGWVREWAREGGQDGSRAWRWVAGPESETPQCSPVCVCPLGTVGSAFRTGLFHARERG